MCVVDVGKGLENDLRKPILASATARTRLNHEVSAAVTKYRSGPGGTHNCG